MRVPQSVYKADIPHDEDLSAFTFSITHPYGVFSFDFRWFGESWECYVTLPSKEVRQAGVYPRVVSWSEFSDFGLIFMTDLQEIKKSSLSMVEVWILKW